MAELVTPSSIHPSIPASSVMSLLMDLQGRISTFITSWETASTTDPSSAQTHSDMTQQNTSEIPPLSSDTNATSSGVEQVEVHADNTRNDLADQERAARLAKIMGPEKGSAVDDLSDAIPEISVQPSEVRTAGDESLLDDAGDAYVDAQESPTDVLSQDRQNQTVHGHPVVAGSVPTGERDIDVRDAVSQEIPGSGVLPADHAAVHSAAPVGQIENGSTVPRTIEDLRERRAGRDDTVSAAADPDHTIASHSQGSTFDQDLRSEIESAVMSMVPTLVTLIESFLTKMLGSSISGMSGTSHPVLPDTTTGELDPGAVSPLDERSLSDGPRKKFVSFVTPGAQLTPEPQVSGATEGLPVADGRAPAVPVDGIPDVRPNVTLDATPLPTAGEDEIIDQLNRKVIEEEKKQGDPRIEGDGYRLRRE